VHVRIAGVRLAGPTALDLSDSAVVTHDGRDDPAATLAFVGEYRSSGAQGT